MVGITVETLIITGKDSREVTHVTSHIASSLTTRPTVPLVISLCRGKEWMSTPEGQHWHRPFYNSPFQHVASNFGE